MVACVSRSSTASLFFNIFFTTFIANLDEEINNRTKIDDTTPLPDVPSWFFYNFRMYTQSINLTFNVAKVIYSANQNDTNSAVLSAVRSLCVACLIARHYYLCNYKFMEIVHGKLKYLLLLQIVFMFTYLIVGAISGAIDPYFASDRTAVIIFFVLPMIIRILSLATASLYRKVMSKTMADGTVVPPSVTISFNLTIHYFYMGCFYFFLLADSSSIFFNDRLLCGMFFILTVASTVRNFLMRERNRKKVFIDLQQSLNEASFNNSLHEVVDGDSKVNDPRHDEKRVDIEIVNPIDVTTDHNYKVQTLEMRNRFTEMKIYVLITTVSCTFMIIISVELAMSMYLYHRNGVPVNWCAPISLSTIDRGFQTILDFFL